MSDLKNEIFYDREFIKDIRRLPQEIQNKFAKLLSILEQDCFDVRLHTKPLSPPLQGLFSFRITREYRVGFKFLSSHAIQLLLVTRRDKIYKRLKTRR